MCDAELRALAIDRDFRMETAGQFPASGKVGLYHPISGIRFTGRVGLWGAWFLGVWSWGVASGGCGSGGCDLREVLRFSVPRARGGLAGGCLLP